MEAVIIKQANPVVVLSKTIMAEHASQSCEVLRPLRRGRGTFSGLWDEDAQHLTEPHMVNCRIYAAGHGTWDQYISPLSAELFRHNT